MCFKWGKKLIVMGPCYTIFSDKYSCKNVFLCTLTVLRLLKVILIALPAPLFISSGPLSLINH